MGIFDSVYVTLPFYRWSGLIFAVMIFFLAYIDVISLGLDLFLFAIYISRSFVLRLILFFVSRLSVSYSML